MRDGERSTARMVPDTHPRDSTSLARSEQPTMQAQHRSQHINQGNSKIATSWISANELTSSTVNGFTTTTNTTATTGTSGASDTCAYDVHPMGEATGSVEMRLRTLYATQLQRVQLEFQRRRNREAAVSAGMHNALACASAADTTGASDASDTAANDVRPTGEATGSVAAGTHDATTCASAADTTGTSEAAVSRGPSQSSD
jgi:hypothetical protein